MGENKEIKVRLGTVICLFIICILIIALIGMYYLGFVKNNEEILKLEQENIELQSQVNILKEDNNKSEIKENEKQDSEIIATSDNAKTINLNGANHTIDFIYDNEIITLIEDELKSQKLNIVFDGKVIKTFTINFYNESLPELLETHIIQARDDKQYLILEVKTYNISSTTHDFCFINETGEILGIISWSDATGISNNGETLSYKINDDSMVYYVPVHMGRINGEDEYGAAAMEVNIYNSTSLNIAVAELVENVELSGRT